MNLQYIYDNSTSPPTQSMLQYAISPDTVFVSTATEQMYANLTITVFNPSTDAVTCQAFRFGFYVGAQYGDLTTGTTGIQSSSDQTNWTISETATENPDIPTLYQFSAPSTGMANQQLAPSQSLVFHLEGILINQAVGEGGVPIVITEATGADTNNLSLVQGEITISKAEPGLSAQLSVIPPTPINRGDEVNFSWQVTGADYWLLYGDSTTPLYDSRYSEPPNATTYGPVSPQLNTTYLLLAYAGQLYTAVGQEVSVMAAQFVINPSANPTSVEAGGSAYLSWQTLDASQLVISASDTNFKPVTLNAPAGQYDYFPDAPNNQWMVSPEKTTTYTLEIYGPGNSQDQGQVQISLTSPQIISFTADPVVFNPGADVELSWQTQGAAPNSATLQQGVKGNQDINTIGLSLPVNFNGYKVNPTGISTYYLSVQGEGSATSELTVFEALGVFMPNLGSYEDSPWTPGAMTFDGANMWFAAYCDNGCALIEARASDGAILQTLINVPNGSNPPSAIAFDGTYIWCAMNVSYQLVKVRVSDGTVVNLPLPSGADPFSLAFDGTNMWVATTKGILCMSTSDGSVLKTLPASGDLASGSLAYDGTYLWAGYQSQYFAQLSTTDGSIQQTVPLGAYDYAGPLCFDGSNIWASVPNGTYGHHMFVIPMTAANTRQNIPLSQMSSALGFDGQYVWSGNYDSTVTRF